VLGALTVALTRGAIPPLVLAMLLLVLPLTWAAIAAENAVFLLLPHRLAPDGSQNVQFMGKLWFAMIAKLLLLVLHPHPLPVGRLFSRFDLAHDLPA
jgi:hypothetical protein